jgi:hypothetical protein
MLRSLSNLLPPTHGRAIGVGEAYIFSVGEELLHRLMVSFHELTYRLLILLDYCSTSSTILTYISSPLTALSSVKAGVHLTLCAAKGASSEERYSAEDICAGFRAAQILAGLDHFLCSADKRSPPAAKRTAAHSLADEAFSRGCVHIRTPSVGAGGGSGALPGHSAARIL